MVSMITVTAQRGEWWEVGAAVTDPTTKRPRDISGRAVSVVVRSGPKVTDPLVAVDGVAASVIDGNSGTAAGGGRIATPGTYYGTFQIGSDADGAGWPVKDQFKLVITHCP